MSFHSTIAPAQTEPALSEDEHGPCLCGPTAEHCGGACGCDYPH